MSNKIRKLNDAGAVIYCRVSTDRQVNEGLSLESQEQRCKKYCSDKGLRVVKVFIEKGESGRNMQRKTFQEMLHFCTKNKEKVRAIVFWQLSRFSRSQNDYQIALAFFNSYGIALVSATENLDSSPSGELIGAILMSINQYESSLIGLRSKTGMIQTRLAGKLTHKAPLGYLNKRSDSGKSMVVLDPERSIFIKKAFSMYASNNYTQKQLLAELNQAGFKTHRGKAISKQTLGRLLRNPTYASLVYVNEEYGSVKGDFPAIVSEALFSKVQTLLGLTSRKEHAVLKKKSDSFPLTRFMRCSVCNAPLSGSFSTGKKGKKYPYYKCRKASKHLNIRQEVLEGDFLLLLETLEPNKGVLKAFFNVAKDVWKQKYKSSLSKKLYLDKNILKLQDRYNKLLDFYLDERITQSDYEQKKLSLSTELFKARIQREELEEKLSGIGTYTENSLLLLENAALHHKRGHRILN